MSRKYRVEQKFTTGWGLVSETSFKLSKDEAKKIFGEECLYIDGEQPEGIESTIIDMTNEKPEIKRIGALYSTILEGIVEN